MTGPQSATCLLLVSVVLWPGVILAWQWEVIKGVDRVSLNEIGPVGIPVRSSHFGHIPRQAQGGGRVKSSAGVEGHLLFHGVTEPMLLAAYLSNLGAGRLSGKWSGV